MIRNFLRRPPWAKGEWRKSEWRKSEWRMAKKNQRFSDSAIQRMIKNWLVFAGKGQ